MLGTDYMRSAGPASRVFGDADWYVDLTGVTQVATRPTATADASLTLIQWDAVQQRAELTCDALLRPGTTLSDPRLNGATPVVRDVEQTFDAKGSRIVAWCAVQAVTRLVEAFTNLVRDFGRTATLKTYLYRIVLEGSTGACKLQAVNPSSGTPGHLPAFGLAGDARRRRHLPAVDASPRALRRGPSGHASATVRARLLAARRALLEARPRCERRGEVDIDSSAPLVKLAALGAALVARSSAAGDAQHGPSHVVDRRVRRAQ